MAWPFRKPEAIAEQFWKWFAQNEHQYRNLAQDPEVEAKIHTVATRLKRFDKRLTCEFSAHETALHEFIVSADGLREAFPAVEQLVAAAPTIPDWKIIAFRQRGDMESTITYGDVELGPQHMQFRLEGDGDRVGIHLYFHDIELNDGVAGAAFILLDNALGEYDMETKVGFIERYQLQTADERIDVKPFEQLPAAFDAFHVMTQNR